VRQRGTVRERAGKNKFLFAALLAAASLGAAVAAGQGFEKPAIHIEDDCAEFAAAADGKIVYSVPHQKHVKKIEYRHDDIWVAEPNGSRKRVLDADKFAPAPPANNFVVDSFSWSPDSKRFVAEIHTETLSEDPEAPPNAIKAAALFDQDGNLIRVAGSKDGYIDNATSATWLADGQTVVYLANGGPWDIMRVRPSDGQTTRLYDGHSFEAVAWDAARNQAFVISDDLSVTRRRFLVRLDLVNETIGEVARVDRFEGSMSVSPSARKIGFFEDGDTIRVIDTATPGKLIEVHAGLGRFEWGAGENRVLLKRGPPEKSGDLVWVGIYDGNFTPILHGLDFHDFQIEPNGRFLVVSQVGRRELMVYPIG